MNAELVLERARVLARKYLELRGMDPEEAEVILDELIRLLLGDSS